MIRILHIPAGIYLAGLTDITLAFILAMMVFMPLFVFLPKLIQRGMQADAQAVVDAFGKNEQGKQFLFVPKMCMTVIRCFSCS